MLGQDRTRHRPIRQVSTGITLHHMQGQYLVLGSGIHQARQYTARNKAPGNIRYVSTGHGTLREKYRAPYAKGVPDIA